MINTGNIEPSEMWRSFYFRIFSYLANRIGQRSQHVKRTMWVPALCIVGILALPEHATADTCRILVELEDQRLAREAKCSQGTTLELFTEEFKLTVIVQKNGASIRIRPVSLVFPNGRSRAAVPFASAPIRLPLFDSSQIGYVEGGNNKPNGYVSFNMYNKD